MIGIISTRGFLRIFGKAKEAPPDFLILLVKPLSLSSLLTSTFLGPNNLTLFPEIKNVKGSLYREKNCQISSLLDDDGLANIIRQSDITCQTVVYFFITNFNFFGTELGYQN